MPSFYSKLYIEKRLIYRNWFVNLNFLPRNSALHLVSFHTTFFYWYSFLVVKKRFKILGYGCSLSVLNDNFFFYLMLYLKFALRNDKFPRKVHHKLKWSWNMIDFSSSLAIRLEFYRQIDILLMDRGKIPEIHPNNV